MSTPSTSRSGGTMPSNFIWYNISMLNLTKRILIVFAGVMLVLAPAAQAFEVLTPVCAPMMKMSAPMDCCKTKCDCTIKTQSPELSVDLPSAAPRLELSLSSFFLKSLAIEAVSTQVETRTIEESPPTEDPLYQTYSDYRL